MKLSSYQRKDQYLFNIIAGFVISVIVAGCSTYYIAQHLDYFVLRLMLTAIPIAILLVLHIICSAPQNNILCYNSITYSKFFINTN